MQSNYNKEGKKKKSLRKDTEGIQEGFFCNLSVNQKEPESQQNSQVRALSKSAV